MRRVALAATAGRAPARPLALAQEQRLAPAHRAAVVGIELNEVGGVSSCPPTKTATERTVSGTSSTRGRAARALVDEDEAEQVGARLDRGVDVVLPRQPAHLHERAREQLAQLRLRVGRLHQRRADEDRVGARELGGGALRARVHAALGDDEAVARCAGDELELVRAVDAERREVAGVDADRPARREPSRVAARLRVVGLDERVEAELCRVCEQVRGRRVVEVAQDEKDSVGACLAQLAQLLLRREEALAEQRQRRSRRARRAGRRSCPPKRSSTSTEIAAAPACAYCGGELAGSASGAQVAGRRRAALDLGDRAQARAARARPRTSCGAAFENATSSSSRAAAAPESMALRASVDALAQVCGVARGGDRARGVQDHADAAAALLARSTRAERRRRSPPASPPRSSSGSQRWMPSSRGSSSYSRTLPSRDLADEVRAGGRELVDAARAVHDERAPRVELRRAPRRSSDERRRVDADDLRAGAGGVRQRAEHVEHGTRPSSRRTGRRVPHRRVVRLREQEAEAELVDRALDPLRLELELEAERLEHVGGARLPTTPRGCRASPRRRPRPRRRARRRSRC